LKSGTQTEWLTINLPNNHNHKATPEYKLSTFINKSKRERERERGRKFEQRVPLKEDEKERTIIVIDKS